MRKLGGPEASAGRPAGFLVRDSDSGSSPAGTGEDSEGSGPGGDECAPATAPEPEEGPFDGVLFEADSASIYIDLTGPGGQRN